MKVSELINFGGYDVITDKDYTDREIKGCYVGDLLSWVMGKANSDDMWITVMSNINIVAVAALADVACIVLAEGVMIADDIIKKANSQDIIILKSSKNSYELAVDYYSLAQHD